MSEDTSTEQILFRVYGVESLPDDIWGGGGDSDYPKNGADHEAHDAANVVFHALKQSDRFEWTGDITGVAMGLAEDNDD